MGEPALVLAYPSAPRRLVDLTVDPGAIDGIFGRGARIVSPAPVADPAIADDLGGPLLVAQHLAGTPHPTVQLEPGAAARPAPPDWSRPERYTVVPQRYVALLAQVRERDGAVPPWLQRLVLSTLFDYLLADSGLYTATGALPVDATDAFHDALRALAADLDDDLIAGYPQVGVTDEMRLAIRLAARSRRGHTRPRIRSDPGRGLDRVSYYFAGEEPGRGVDAATHRKIRAVDFLGRTLLHERIAWVPTGPRVDIDPTDEVTPAVGAAAVGEGRLARYRRIVAENRGIAARLIGDVRVRLRARKPDATARYHHAWLLMDRDTAAQDNAEHLYRYLRTDEPQVNAWFVLAADSPDWPRLHTEGFRLLAYGSPEHFVALLHCVHLVSSQVDSYVVKPFRKHLLGRPRWRYTFLQHGVIKDDLSRWLNGKPIDLFITSTPDEQRSIVADGSPYVFTDLETVMTGLARHDRLLALAGRRPPEELVIMPTWRRELLGVQSTGNERGLQADFWTSDYALGWQALLESDRLRQLCERQGWRLHFVPHPNMQDYLATSALPPHVRASRFTDIDVQEVLAGAAVVVTDYSSLATEAAYIQRPVVYYQFDREAFFAGGHVYRRGAWSYEDQGFGPVTESVDAAVAALEHLATQPGPDAVYAERMRDTFPFRDGRCCERTVAAIRRINASGRA